LPILDQEKPNRWADGKTDRLPDLAAELIRLEVATIVSDGTSPTQAAKKVTSIGECNLSIVF